MPDPSVFDYPGALSINAARQDWVRSVLKDLQPRHQYKTAADIGCGVGYFSGFLKDFGYTVRGWDAREENIEEARRRHPGIEFDTINVEDQNFSRLGKNDLVLCFGLLYHLENPFLAVRNLYSITGHTLLVESMVVPSDTTSAVLADECLGDNQGVTYMALIPSEKCLIKMLYCAGFKNVYGSRVMPDDVNFRPTERFVRRRTVLVASDHVLESPYLELAERPVQWHEPIWHHPTATTPAPLPVRALRRVKNSVSYRFRRWMPAER